MAYPDPMTTYSTWRRGRIGTFTAVPPMRDDAAALDFAEAFVRKVFRPASLNPRLATAVYSAAWRNAAHALHVLAPALELELDAADRKEPGSLALNPSVLVGGSVLPEAVLEPHGGFVYHYATKVLHGGANDNDDVQRSRVALLDAPEDGEVRRVLDLGCRIGQTATALKERFLSAEVWAVDEWPTLLRYAHTRAVRMGSTVHVAQARIDRTGFPDSSFDVVVATVEDPFRVEAVIEEAVRLLRRNGTLAMVDGRLPGSPSAALRWPTVPALLRQYCAAVRPDVVLGVMWQATR